MLVIAVCRRFLRRLDYCPGWLGLPLGIATGALIAATVLIWAPAVLGATAFVLLLGGAARLAWSGEPVAVLVEGTELQPGPPAQTPPVPGLEMVHISGGVFLVGSPADETGRFEDEGPLHEVHVSAFAMMRVPVTRRLYQGSMRPETPVPEADERPMTGVSWFEAVQFCNRLSEQQDLTPCYRIDRLNVQWERNTSGYRLPTEAEWEYACRAGAQSRFCGGDNEHELEHYAWYHANSQGAVHAVGRKAPNSWGLHDMHGNVYEWCWDWYGPYDAQPQTNPGGVLEGRYRVVRGGSFGDPPVFLRSALRVNVQPERLDTYLGFRCVRGSPQP